MAKCDQGYLCDICAEPVTNITTSSLYLRFVLGEVEIHELFSAPERHLNCHPELARFIIHEKFKQPAHDVQNASESEEKSNIEKEKSDVLWQREQETRVTAAWLRLREVVKLGIPITEYPLVSKTDE